MNPELQSLQLRTRRHFLRDSMTGIGAAALSTLMHGEGARAAGNPAANPLAPKAPPRRPRATRIISLHMSGAPPQHELFDYKPELVKHDMQPCPYDLIKVLEMERLPFIDLKARRPKLLGTPYKFHKYGECGMELSELLPGIGSMADEIALVRSMSTDQFNHAPGELFLFTGTPRAGGASMGSWVTWGIGSESANLPGFVVMVSGGTDPTGGKSLWGTSFLPSVYQGVQCRTTGDPILFVSDPEGMSRQSRRRSLDTLRQLNELELEQFGDPETQTRISQYELAFRMQMAVPGVMDITQEPQHVHEAYGTQPGQESFANNCLLARRLIESGVRFVQLFDWGWDFHGTGKDNDIVQGLPAKAKVMDQAVAALLKDLKQRGLLEETLVVWTAEFGRTPMNEERNGSKFLGRDHHPHCFSIWMAGGGVKGGLAIGQTDELGYFVTENKMTIPDLQATILHLLGFDPYRLSFSYQGLDQRLIGPTDEARVRTELLA